MLDGPVWLTVLRQGLPVAVGLASHALFNLVDLAMVGRFGEGPVAGVHVATIVNFVPMILGNAVSIGAMSVMARCLGAGDTARARAVSTWSQWFMIAFGLVLGAFGAASAGPCIAVQGLAGPPAELGVDYLVVSHLGTFTMFALMQSTASMRALGESIVPALLLIGANVLNLGLNLLLMFGWETVGIAGLGPIGAAYATVLARAIAAAAGLAWLARPGCRLRLGGVTLRPPAGVGRELARLSAPSTAQMLVRALAVIVLTRLTADAGGVDAVVALSVTTRLDTMILFSAIGYAGAATTVVGHAIGANATRRARAAGRQAGWQALGFGLLVLAGFVAGGADLIALFVADANPRVIELGLTYLGSAALGQVLATFAIAVTGAMHGAGQTLRPLLLDLLGFGLAAVAAWVWARELTVSELWWGFVGVHAGLLAIHAWHMEFGDWTGDSR